MLTSTNQKRIVQLTFFKSGWRSPTVTPSLDWKLLVILPLIALGFGVVTGLWMGE